MIPIFLLDAILVVWHAHFNCVASPIGNRTESKTLHVWANEIKVMLDDVIEGQDISKEALKDKIKKINAKMAEMTKATGVDNINENFYEKLEGPLEDFKNYLEGAELRETNTFLENVKAELGTFLIEYELFVIEKEEWKTENLKVLTEQIDKILEIVKYNEAYCEMAYLENAKTEFLTNLQNEDEIKNGVEKFVESIKFNIFENELKAKIDTFDKTSYIYAGNFTEFLKYIEMQWPKKNNMRWNTLGKTLEKINEKRKNILGQLDEITKEFEEKVKKLKEQFEELQKTEKDYEKKLEDINEEKKDKIVKLEKTDDNYKLKLEEIVQETKEAYDKLRKDLQNISFFLNEPNDRVKEMKEGETKMKAEESIKNFLFLDSLGIIQVIKTEKSEIKAFKFIEKKMEEKKLKEKEEKERKKRGD